MKKLLLVASVVFGFTASAAQAQVTLLDQIGPDATAVNGQAASASQRFEPANAAFHVVVGDDFVVPAGGSVRLGHVQVVLTAFNGTGAAAFPAIQNYELQIYSSPAAAASNLTGDISSSIIPTANATQTVPFGTNVNPSGLIDLDVTSFNINLAPGTYWVGILPRLYFTPNGQMGVSLSTFPGGVRPATVSRRIREAALVSRATRRKMLVTSLTESLPPPSPNRLQSHWSAWAWPASAGADSASAKNCSN